MLDQERKDAKRYVDFMLTSKKVSEEFYVSHTSTALWLQSALIHISFLEKCIDDQIVPTYMKDREEIV